MLSQFCAMFFPLSNIRFHVFLQDISIGSKLYVTHSDNVIYEAEVASFPPNQGKISLMGLVLAKLVVHL